MLKLPKTVSKRINHKIVFHKHFTAMSLIRELEKGRNTYAWGGKKKQTNGFLLKRG